MNLRRTRRWGDNPRPGINEITLDRFIGVVCAGIVGVLVALLIQGAI